MKPMLPWWQCSAMILDGYDVADHDPADSCWGLHRRLFAWAYVGGSFRPSHAMAAARLHERRYGDLI